MKPWQRLAFLDCECNSVRLKLAGLVCVCVCVCVRAHVHTHAHTHTLLQWGEQSPQSGFLRPCQRIWTCSWKLWTSGRFLSHSSGMITLALKRQSGGTSVEDQGVEAREEKVRQWSLWQVMRTWIGLGPGRGRNKVEVQGISVIEDQRDTDGYEERRRQKSLGRHPEFCHEWLLEGGATHGTGNKPGEATQTTGHICKWGVSISKRSHRLGDIQPIRH